MTDPLSVLGAAVSIVQLVQVSAELSIKFHTISKQIKNAPRVFEDISNEIASTTTILQLLASELEDQDRSKLHKPTAVQKTKELMTDCAAIYDILRKRITPDVDEDASDRAKSRAQWKTRLKMPYMADDLAQLQNKLVGVKTWLNIMLNTLSLGVQAKSFSGSQDAKELLLEQRQMLEVLIQETRLLRDGVGQPTLSNVKPCIQTAAQTGDKLVQDPYALFPNTSLSMSEPCIPTLVDTNASQNDIELSIKNNSRDVPDVHFSGMEHGSSAPTQVGIWPNQLSFYAIEIREQARLISDLVRTIEQPSYAISSMTRSSMHVPTLNLHVQQWRVLAHTFGYEYLMSMVEDFPDLRDAWTTAMFAAQRTHLNPGITTPLPQRHSLQTVSNQMHQMNPQQQQILAQQQQMAHHQRTLQQHSLAQAAEQQQEQQQQQQRAVQQQMMAQQKPHGYHFGDDTLNHLDSTETRTIQRHDATPANNALEAIGETGTSYPSAMFHTGHNYTWSDRGSTASNRRRQGQLPKHVTDILRAWFYEHLEHPYPTDEDKEAMIRKTNLTLGQITNWFINARRRHWPALKARQRATTNLMGNENRPEHGEDEHSKGDEDRVPGLSKDVEDLLREYTMLSEDELKALTIED